MKTIAVIFPVNNPEIVSQADLTDYCTNEIEFILHYADTPLKEANTADDTNKIEAVVVTQAQELAKAGTTGIILFAFGNI